MRDAVTNVYTPDAWEEVPCPFCNSSDHKVYERFGSELQYTYVKCKSCGLIYQSPRPRYNQDFIDSCYASYYQYAENLTAEDLNNISESSLKMFQKEIAYISKFDTKKLAVLDIGSGMGTFLSAAKSYYKKLTGLDVSQKMADFVNKITGIAVYIKQFEEFESGELFSLIHMSHVIEHIPNPNEWLQHAKKLLVKDGILVINVPNKRGLSHTLKHIYYKLGITKQFTKTWNDPTRTPDHLFEPSIKSFTYLLEKNGFEIIEYYTYSRRDPASNSTFLSRFLNRVLKIGSNITFISRIATS